MQYSENDLDNMVHAEPEFQNIKCKSYPIKESGLPLYKSSTQETQKKKKRF